MPKPILERVMSLFKPSAPSVVLERRRRRRYTANTLVRVQIEGLREALTAEILDLSAVGCFLKGDDISFIASAGDRLAFGFLHQMRAVALARGRVVRREPGVGLGVVIDHANDVMDGFLGRLAVSQGSAA